MVEAIVSPLRVLVPMKPLDQAKSRLWADVPTVQRKAVILLMLDRVIRSVVSALGPSACQVIGGDEVVRRVTELAGAAWREDPADKLNASLWVGMQAAYAEGCEATLYMPGDLPLVSPEDVGSVAKASDGYTRPVGVRASQDGGTNALLMPAEAAFEPLLGLDSFARHTEAAERQGTPLVSLDLPGIAFDLDSHEDLEWAQRNVGEFLQRLDGWQAWLSERRS